MPMPGAYLSLKPAPLAEAGAGSARPTPRSGERDRAADPIAAVLRKRLRLEPDSRNPMIALLTRISGRPNRLRAPDQIIPEAGTRDRERGNSRSVLLTPTTRDSIKRRAAIQPGPAAGVDPHPRLA